MDNWPLVVAVFLTAYGCLRCSEYLERIANCYERMERMQRDRDSVASSIGTDIARGVENIAHHMKPPKSFLGDDY